MTVARVFERYFSRHVFAPAVVRGVWLGECRACGALRRAGFVVGRGGASIALVLYRAPSSGAQSRPRAWTTEKPLCRK